MIPIIIAEMTVAQGVAVIVPVISAVGLFVAGLVVHSSRQNRAKIDELTIEVALLKQQISPFWASLQSKIADALHHPGEEHQELDHLLEKLQAGTYTVEEKILLETTLQQMSENASTDTAEKAATLLQVMPMVEKEKQGKLPDTDMRTMEQKKIAGS